MATRQIPWARVLVEGVVIVTSILLAFGIDAWWEGRGERVEEQEILTGLHEDFRGNAELLEAVIRDHSTTLQRFQQLPDVAEGLPEDSLVGVLTALYGGRTFDPYQGTLEATLSAGKLSLITDVELRATLGEWVGLRTIWSRTLQK